PSAGGDLEGVADGTTAGAPGQAGDLPLPGEEAAAPGSLTRDAALATAERIIIDTPRLHGSINLTGARLDDLTLGDYRETIDPDSGEIILLSPLQAPRPYLADFGWVGLTGDVVMPDGSSQWVSDDTRLDASTPVTLRWDNGQGLIFERQIALDDEYMFTVTQTVTNQSGGPVELAPYGRIVRYFTPDTLGFFILHEGPYGVFDGTLEEYSYGDLQDEDSGVISHQSTGGWLGFTDKYWLVSLAPDQEKPFSAQFAHRLVASQDRYFATYRGSDEVVQDGAQVSNTLQLFAGAKEVDTIDSYSAQTCNSLTQSTGFCEPRGGIEKFDLTIDFGWFYFLTKPIFYAISAINKVVGNFGVAILVLTVFVKLIFFPLANKSYQSMSKMKALQPEMMELKERFGEDKQGMQKALMDLYKREKVNPAAGCLPILVQIPVFFALYKVLFVTIEMRHAPFFGWIKDLSQPDPTSILNLFGLIPIDLPPFLWIGVWPIIMGLTMYAQQKLNPAPTDPVQARIFMFLPFIFTIMLAGFPAGLVIYWAWNNALSILQQWVIMRRMGVKIGGGVDAPTTPSAPAPSVTRKKKAEAEAENEASDDADDEAPEQETAANDEDPSPDLTRARTVKKGDGRGRGRRSKRAGKRRS
ncbi:MAG: membrane protein insertase YidC, partial [Pseudomonadota bacterium]